MDSHATNGKKRISALEVARPSAYSAPFWQAEAGASFSILHTPAKPSARNSGIFPVCKIRILRITAKPALRIQIPGQLVEVPDRRTRFLETGSAAMDSDHLLVIPRCFPTEGFEKRLRAKVPVYLHGEGTAYSERTFTRDVSRMALALLTTTDGILATSSYSLRSRGSFHRWRESLLQPVQQVVINVGLHFRIVL